MPSFRGDLILQVLETGHDDRLTLLVKRLQLFARGQRSLEARRVDDLDAAFLIVGELGVRGLDNVAPDLAVGRA